MTLNIFGQKIRVLKRKNLARDSGLVGLWEPHIQLISIDADLVGKEYMQCLIHEIIHAVISRTGISQGLREQGVEEIISENVATALIENFKLTKI
jgi:hypothetical protein